MTKDDLILFKTIFEQTPISTQIFTPDGTTLLVNKAWERLWNVTFQELGSYNILEDNQLEENGLMSSIKRAFQGEQVDLPEIRYDAVKTLHIKKASIRWLAAHMYPIKNSEDTITHVVLQHYDVTEARDRQIATSRLAAIVSSSPDAIVSKTLEGIITSWNKGAERILGYEASEIIGKHITTIIPKELHKQEQYILNQIKNDNFIDHLETERLHKNGQRITVSLSVSPIKDNHGVIIGASKIARDITEKLKNEKIIRESEERLRIALNAGKIGVWDWNIIDNTLTWTENVYVIHGVSPNDFVVTYKNFSALIHPDDKARARTEIQNSLEHDHEFNIEFRIVTPIGDIRWVTTRALIYRDEKGKPVRMLGATSDITKQKLLDQDKNDFLTMASHELKTPITSLSMFVDLLIRHLDTVTDDKSQYFARRIKDQTFRVTELINDLLDVSRIETGKLMLKKERFSLCELIQDTVEGLQTTTSHHRIKISCTNDIIISADRYRMYQVLVNLITNAIKYSPKNTEITLSVKNDGDHIVLAVKDRGVGIAKASYERIFDRLYQVRESTKNTYPGLGLGLYITREIVERHQGKIWVESILKKGSTFFVRIPKKQDN